MFVIHRKLGQSIRIGPVEISIVKISNSAVKIGINAPRNIKVWRSEENREDVPADNGMDGFGETEV